MLMEQARAQPNLIGLCSHTVYFKCKTVHFIFLVLGCASKVTLGEMTYLDAFTRLYIETHQSSLPKNHTQETQALLKATIPRNSGRSAEQEVGYTATGKSMGFGDSTDLCTGAITTTFYLGDLE